MPCSTSLSLSRNEPDVDSAMRRLLRASSYFCIFSGSNVAIILERYLSISSIRPLTVSFDSFDMSPNARAMPPPSCHSLKSRSARALLRLAMAVIRAPRSGAVSICFAYSACIASRFC